MNTETAPLWLILVTQVISIAGDAVGQRVGRVGYKFSRRHLMLGIAMMNFIQNIVFLCIAQAFLPTNITGAVYIDGEKVPCYEELDIGYEWALNCSDPVYNCHEIPCPSQGPFTFLFQLYHYPSLLIVGCVNWAYYAGEVLLYKEPLGLLFLVLSSLFSSFLINPVSMLIGMPISSSIPLVIYIGGVFGAFFCTLEVGSSYGWLFWKPLVNKYISLMRRTFFDERKDPGNENIEEMHESVRLRMKNKVLSHMVFEDAGTYARLKYAAKVVYNTLHVFKRVFRVAIPFILLSFAYAMWFVLQKYFNDVCRINVFSFTVMDKMLLILFVLPFLGLVDGAPRIKEMFEIDEFQEETFVWGMINTVRDSPWVLLFVFRLLINGRSFIYFYIAILYDLNKSYLELTLIRILLTWISVLILCLALPSFINASKEERRKAFAPFQVFLKFIGSVLIVLSLIVLNS